jgi:hypothetical protein
MEATSLPIAPAVCRCQHLPKYIICPSIAMSLRALRTRSAFALHATSSSAMFQLALTMQRLILHY